MASGTSHVIQHCCQVFRHATPDQERIPLPPQHHQWLRGLWNEVQTHFLFLGLLWPKEVWQTLVPKIQRTEQTGSMFSRKRNHAHPGIPTDLVPSPLRELPPTVPPTFSLQPCLPAFFHFVSISEELLYSFLVTKIYPPFRQCVSFLIQKLGDLKQRGFIL